MRACARRGVELERLRESESAWFHRRWGCATGGVVMTLALTALGGLFVAGGEAHAADAGSAVHARPWSPQVPDGEVVAVTGPLAAGEPLHAATLVRPGPYAYLAWDVEVFAWQQLVTTTELGPTRSSGSREVAREVRYERGWTSDP